jgi:hypothetical protein
MPMALDVLVMVEKEERLEKALRLCRMYLKLGVVKVDRGVTTELLPPLVIDRRPTAATPTASIPPHCSMFLRGHFGCSRCSAL